jgi:hypothetical protein
MPPVNLGTGVTPGSNAQIRTEKAGVTILAGQSVYRSTTDQRVYLAVTTSQASAAAVGIAIGSAPTAGQEVRVVWDGDVENCATLVKGESYHVCDTAGSVDVSTALGTNDWVCYMGSAYTTTTLRLRINVLGAQHA